MPSGTIPIAQLPHNMEENCGKRSIKTREWVQGAAPRYRMGVHELDSQGDRSNSVSPRAPCPSW